jgi:hypothetical protein
MNRKILGVFVAILAVAMIALPISVAFAENDKNGKFIPVSGEAVYTLFGPGSGTEIVQSFVGRNFIWAKTGSSATWTGDIATTDATCDHRTIFFGYDLSSYSFEGQVTHLKWTLINPTIAGEPYVGELVILGGSGNWRIISGTGELANLHGQGTQEGTVPGGMAYEGYVHFYP